MAAIEIAINKPFNAVIVKNNGINIISLIIFIMNFSGAENFKAAIVNIACRCFRL
ncbi:MAG: hypothetical protein HRT38_04370 [Alteromonadaceae bacterium]|nr:hypothetical protein [Alteromonadaceae bacterium]